jgi:hypothetical protein
MPAKEIKEVVVAVGPTGSSGTGVKGGQSTQASAELAKGKAVVLAALQKTIRAELSSICDDPDEWLDTENPTFGGDRPKDVVKAGHGDRVLDRIRALKYGIFS